MLLCGRYLYLRHRKWLYLHCMRLRYSDTTPDTNTPNTPNTSDTNAADTDAPELKLQLLSVDMLREIVLVGVRRRGLQFPVRMQRLLWLLLLVPVHRHHCGNKPSRWWRQSVPCDKS